MATMELAGCFPRNSDTTSRHRSQYKCSTPPWKEKYRKRCLDRLKNGRQKFVSRFRQGSDGGDATLVNEVMNEEWMRLSEENRELPAWPPTRKSCIPFPGTELDEAEMSSLDQVLAIMDEIQNELIEEERNILAQYEESVNFEEASLCAAIECLRTEDVKCPVCKKHVLHQNKQVIFCACGLRVDTEHDALNLTYVHNQIEEALASHSLKGERGLIREENCTAEPQFLVSHMKELGVSNLLLQCNVCQYLYIIL